MSYEAIYVDRYPIDQALTEAATVGPDAAHLAHVYLDTPRALVWRNASSDWKLLVLLLPMATRLSMLRNPIFSSLVRDWGLNVRFIGVDEYGRVFDFRRLLSDPVLQKLVDALAHCCDTSGDTSGDTGSNTSGDSAGGTSTDASGASTGPQRHTLDTERSANPTLDILFSALSRGTLTMLETRRSDWPSHLAREHRLEPNVVGSLFDRDTRFPDFMRSLQAALRNDHIDIPFYSRVLRSIDLREEAVERRISHIVQSTLDTSSVDKLLRSSVGLHLGCYNWLAIDPRNRAHRHYVLQRLGCFAQFFSDSLLSKVDVTAEMDADASIWPRVKSPNIAKQIAQAVDSGQDRVVIDALAQRFAISSNTVRHLWRAAPAALGTPVTWHLQQILLRLDAIEPRDWPATPNGWLAFKEAAAL